MKMKNLVVTTAASAASSISKDSAATSLGSSITKTTLYSAYFCPYAQRVWCALNALEVDFELVESLQIDPETEEYIKNQSLLKYNPAGLVPTLVQQQQQQQRQRQQQQDSNDATPPLVVCDSMEILKQLYNDDKHCKDTKQQLLSDAQYYNQHTCSPFYGVLMKPTAQQRLQAWQEMMSGMHKFASHLVWQDDGQAVSFYQTTTTTSASTNDTSITGKENDCPTLVDFCVFPFLHRLHIIQHYKGFQLGQATLSLLKEDDTDKALQQQQHDEDAAAKIFRWIDKMQALPAVKTTLADRQDLIAIYARYADGTDKSRLGDFVRQGKQAHEV